MAVPSKTDVCNLALLYMGVSQSLTDADTDTSREAVSLRVVWDMERRFVLRDFAWPFARKYTALAFVSGTPAVPTNNDWIFAYAYPADALLIQRLVTCAGRQECSPPPFVIGRDGTSGAHLIFTNLPNAQAEYTVDVTLASEFDAAFVSMFAWRLAAVLGPSLSRNADIVKLATEAYAQAKQQAIGRALQEGEYAIASGDPDPRTRDIFNLALTRLGISRNLITVDPELTFAALWPRICFADERDYILREFPWPFSTRYVNPALAVGSPTQPINNDWVYAYRFPSSVGLYARRFVSPLGRCAPVTRQVPFRIGRNPYYANTSTVYTVTLSTGATWTTADTITATANSSIFTSDEVGNTLTLTDGTNTVILTIAGYTSDTVVTGTPNITVPSALRSTALYRWTRAWSGRCVYTNQPSLPLETTVQVTDPDEWDASFLSLLAWRIAALLAPSIGKTKTDPKLVDRVHQAYMLELSSVKRMALNEEQPEPEPEAEWIRSYGTGSPYGSSWNADGYWNSDGWWN